MRSLNIDLQKFSRGIAAALAGAVLIAVTVPASAAVLDPSANLVWNGDFENTSFSNPNTGLVNGNTLANLATGPGASWDVFETIPGWTTADGAGIEVQTNRTLRSIDAHSGQHYIELDSHPRRTSNSTMEQMLFLDPGAYVLSFFYSPRNGDVNTNGIDYALAGMNGTVLMGGVTGPSAAQGTQVGHWTEITTLFNVTDTDLPVILSFTATGTQNTLGGFIDSVSVSAVPLPAGLALLLTALGILGIAGTRRQRPAL